MAKKAALGKGLGALINDADEFSNRPSSTIFDEVNLSQIVANPFQPRTEFDNEALQDLAASIEKMGVIQPITLRKVGHEQYQIIAGERRFRASGLAGLNKIPAYIRKAEDEAMLEMALVENIQREDLDAIEIALSYQRLIDEFSLTQEEMSKRVGKKRATVANYVRLLKLPSDIQFGIRDKKIQMGHARALLGIEDPATQLMIYEQILEYNFSVRKVEEIARDLNEASVKSEEASDDKSIRTEKVDLQPQYKKLKDQLSGLFRVNVGFSRGEKGSGKITIPFKSDDELEKLMNLLDKLQ